MIGPFDDEGKSGSTTAYPPEQGVDLAGRYPGKAREVAWRPLPRDAEELGFVALGAALRPAREVAAFALAVVVAPRDERVRLWFGGSGAAKVWVNGALALEDATYHPARLDQRGAAVSLRKGPNRILVKLCHQAGAMGFYLRLADEKGEGRSFPAGDPGAPPPEPGPAPAPLEDAVAVLTRRTAEAGSKGSAQAHATLAAVLAARASGDREERRAAAEAARAAALAPRSVDAQLTAAALEEERPARRLLLDGALRAAPDDARVLRALAGEELDVGRPQEAARLLQRAVAVAPGWPEPWVLLAEALDRSGLPARAALLAEETAARFPTSPPAIRAATRFAVRLGRIDEAIRRGRTLLALRFDDDGARASLASHLLDRGDLDGALALLEEGLRLDPADLAQRLRLADLLAANGRGEAAEAAYARAIGLCPEEADAWERRGRTRLQAGRAREAKEDLVRALELRPQSSALKELVRSLAPDEEQFWKPYQLDAAGAGGVRPRRRCRTRTRWCWVSCTSPACSPPASPPPTCSASSRCSPPAAPTPSAASSSAGRPTARRSRSSGRWCRKPDGRVVESHDESLQSTSEPWYRLYYDTLARTLSFPELSPGDVLEVAWRVDDTASENLLSDYFGDLTFLDEPWRKARVDYLLLAPESRAIHANQPAGVEHAVRPLPGGVREHRWSARDLPRLVPEPGMPGWTEVARFLHVSTYETWEEVNRFYWRLVRDQLRPDGELRATAGRLAAAAGQPLPAQGREARAALVRAAYDFVVTQTRYVGLEFGIHGYKPYRVDQVLSRRFGDCKDKASLLHALLEAMGIDSRLVLLRMRKLGRLPERPASLAGFNHAILYVPELDLWLDGTAAYSGSRDLPAEDRGATVLVVNPSGPPRFTTLPEARPDENRLESRARPRPGPRRQRRGPGVAGASPGWRPRPTGAPTASRTAGPRCWSSR